MSTKGSIISSFPNTLPDFSAQSELRDPTAEDTTLAEGRDANKWSAEIEAIAGAIGVGGRGQVTLSGGSAVVEEIKYVHNGALVIYLGTSSLSLVPYVLNYIYLDISDNVAKAAISGFPSTPYIPLGIYDGASYIIDFRPHDLEIIGLYNITDIIPGEREESGTVLIPELASGISVVFFSLFDGNQNVQLTCRLPSDVTPRIANFSNVTGSGMVVTLDSAAPSGGVYVHWRVKGQLGTDTTGGS